jgi:hypothetical protein
MLAWYFISIFSTYPKFSWVITLEHPHDPFLNWWNKIACRFSQYFVWTQRRSHINFIIPFVPKLQRLLTIFYVSLALTVLKPQMAFKTDLVRIPCGSAKISCKTLMRLILAIISILIQYLLHWADFLYLSRFSKGKSSRHGRLSTQCNALLHSSLLLINPFNFLASKSTWLSSYFSNLNEIKFCYYLLRQNLTLQRLILALSSICYCVFWVW